MNKFLPKNKLPSQSGFSRVFNQALYKFSVSELLVLALPNGEAVARLGVIVPKKNVARAVIRHRIKRVVREAFRLNQQTLAGLDIIVLALRPASKAPNSLIFSHLSRAWFKISRQLAKSATQSTHDQT